MSELEYVKMVEVPISSSDVTFKPVPRKKKDVKKKVIDKVNGEKTDSLKTESKAENKKLFSLPARRKVKKVKPQVEDSSVEIKNNGFDIVSMQVVTIFVLIVGIILTNIFFENSGMNRLMRSVFNKEEVTIQKTYSEFTALSPSKTSDVTLSDGVMTIAKGSIYSPCDGVIENVYNDNGLYVVTVSHSDSFSSVISGLEHVYASVGDTVYPSVPVGYSDSEVSVSMFNNDAILTSYTLTDERIQWLS